MTSTSLSIHHRFSQGMYVRERAAESSAPADTIFYIHGLGESGLCFEKLMADPRLSRWRHLAPDMPGYGKSPWLDEPLGLEEHARRLADWIDAEIESPVVVLGHSMGGVLGTLLGERSSGLVRGFLNVEGNVSLDDCGFSIKMARRPIEEILHGEFDRILDELYLDGIEDRALRTYYPSARMCDPRAYHRNGVELVKLSESEGLAERMADLGVPQLYVLGSPGGAGERSQVLLSRSGVPYLSVENAGHWPFLDRPAAFLDAVVPFLERL